MGRTITAYLLTSQDIFYSGSGASNPNALPITNTSGTVTTLNSYEFPVKVVITGQMQRIASSNYWDDLYIGDSNRGNGYRIIHFWLLGGSGGVTSLNSSTSSTDNGVTYTWQTFTGIKLKGKALYLYDTNAGSMAYHNNQWTVKITTHYTSTPPTTITVPSTSDGYCTISWTGATAGDGTISGYRIEYQDRTSSSASWPSDWTYLTTVTSSTVSGSANVYTNGTNNGQRRFRIRTNTSNSNYNSTYTTSSAVTTIRPTVAQGDVATKTQMDTLRHWKGAKAGGTVSGINAVTQGNTITATDGNTYKSGLTASTTKIAASWYNSD